MNERFEFEQLGDYLPKPDAEQWQTDAAWAGLRSRMQPRRSRRWLSAAAIVVAAGVGVMQYQQNRTVQYATTTGTREVRLPDGSHVRLAPGTRITAKKRNVELVGQAYFDVVHNEKRPFTVHARTSEVRVLGTSFLVNAYGDRVTVSVTTGRVLFRDGVSGKSVVLAQGESSNTTHDDSAAFHDAKLQDIASVLERWYSVRIKFADSTLAATRLTVYVPRRSLQEVLDLLATTVNANYRQSGATVTFSSK